MKAKTTEEFINECKLIYGDTYDYSLVDYKNNHTEIEIFCKEHGSIKITPNKLLCKKTICKKCRRNKEALKALKTYLEKAKKIHKNKYDYSKVDFIDLSKDVTIICPTHGYFQQSINEHVIKNHGCPKCSGKDLTTEEWIKILSEKHNNKYDYSKFIYKGSLIRSEIICPEHGSFFISPSKHKNGGNCQSCAIDIMKLKVRLKIIERIRNNKFNGYQMTPSYNKKACKIFDEISKNENNHIQHAMNGGEYYIEKLGYWLDGYDIINNVAYEYDEKHHFKKGQLSEKDIDRQNEIENFLKCKFIRIKDL
jgi:hypothetical protein